MATVVPSLLQPTLPAISSLLSQLSVFYVMVSQTCIMLKKAFPTPKLLKIIIHISFILL